MAYRGALEVEDCDVLSAEILGKVRVQHHEPRLDAGQDVEAAQVWVEDPDDRHPVTLRSRFGAGAVHPRDKDWQYYS